MQRTNIAEASQRLLLERGQPIAAPRREPLKVDGLDWYVLKTEHQREKSAASALGEVGIRAYLPTVTIRIFRQRPFRGVNVERALFPNYVFAGLQRAAERFYDARRAKGVIGILGAQGSPQRIAGSVLADIDSALLAGLLTKPVDPRSFSKGEHIRISDGPFSASHGSIEAVLPHETYKVLVSLFGRSVPLTLHACQIEKV
jgi:transcription antitermination factor NusG